MGEGGCKDEGETSKFEDRAKARVGVRARVRGFTSVSSSQSNSLCRLASSAGLTSPILLPPLLPLLLLLLFCCCLLCSCLFCCRLCFCCCLCCLCCLCLCC